MSALRRWETAECDGAAVERLGAALSIHPALARVLVARGVSEPAAAERFLGRRLSDVSDPFLIEGMRAAVERVDRALEAGERVAVFGDYDADGVTATALMVAVLRAMGADPRPFLPRRIEEGYGLNEEALRRCLDGCRPDLLVTVDCGTGSVAAVESARSRGVEVVVTDHHEISGPLAPAAAVVNPRREGTPPDLRALSGVGVAFKFCHALLKHRLATGREASVRGVDLRDYLDWVAIGTVADVVPLLGENRIFVHHGLALLNRRPSVGLDALREVARIDGAVDTYHLGYVIGPRLNAVGRLGSADRALETLLAADPERARALARELDAANRERKAIEEEICEAAGREAQAAFDASATFGIVAAGEGWHAGTVGIVAARLCARFNRPAVVIGFEPDGSGRGSGRSIEGFSLVDALKACAGTLESFGGHAMAAGLRIRRENLDAFRDAFGAACAGALRSRDLRPVHRVDAWIDLGEVNEALLAGLERLAPFGVGNPAPMLGLRGVRPLGRPRVVGRDHLKMTVASGSAQVDAIGFGLAGIDVPDGALDLLAHVRENTYLGRRAPQIQIKDLRAAEPGPGGLRGASR